MWSRAVLLLTVCDAAPAVFAGGRGRAWRRFVRASCPWKYSDEWDGLIDSSTFFFFFPDVKSLRGPAVAYGLHKRSFMEAMDGWMN